MLENKEYPLTIFCDLSKVFDCADYSIILCYLKVSGIIELRPVIPILQYTQKRLQSDVIYEMIYLLNGLLFFNSLWHTTELTPMPYHIFNLYLRYCW